MSYNFHLTDKVRHLMFDALADTLPNGYVWAAWLYEVNTREEEVTYTGRWPFRRKVIDHVTRVKPVVRERFRLACEKRSDALIFSDLRDEVSPYNGRVLGLNIYDRKVGGEFIMFIPLHANTTRVTPGSTIHLVDPITVDSKRWIG